MDRQQATARFAALLLRHRSNRRKTWFAVGICLVSVLGVLLDALWFRWHAAQQRLVAFFTLVATCVGAMWFIRRQVIENAVIQREMAKLARALRGEANS